MREVKLGNGAVLKVGLADFESGENLKIAVLKEVKDLKISSDTVLDLNFYKDLFCVAYSSALIRAAIWKCFDRCTYNDARITRETFEPVEARSAYMEVMFEVMVENLQPFMKDLYAKLSAIKGRMETFLA